MGTNTDELEILLLLLGALRYQEMGDTGNGSGDGVQNGNGTVTDHVADMEDNVFTTTEHFSEQEHEHGLQQPRREELKLLECHNGHSHDRSTRSPLASPVRQKLTPSLPTLLEGQ